MRDSPTSYDLPNETAYAETCAAIGFVFWNHRMLQSTALHAMQICWSVRFIMAS